MGYRLEDYEFHFSNPRFVLDVGCGPGYHMRILLDQGHRVVGIDPDFDRVRDCRDQGMSTLQALGERLPFGDGTFDGVVCKVVLPYTREEVVVGEIARILKPGGQCYMQCHGAGYYLRYAITPMEWRQSVHGVRTLINTWVWVATGRRLPGFLGTSIYQSRRRLAKYYRQHNLRVHEETPSPTYFALPVFTYQVLEKGVSPRVPPAP
jgi:SAM-dependent methyltransferase